MQPILATQPVNRRTTKAAHSANRKQLIVNLTSEQATSSNSASHQKGTTQSVTLPHTLTVITTGTT